MEELEFRKLVNDSILELPENIRQKIKNCAICVERKPSREQLKRAGLKHNGALLGLYEGVPQTTWGKGLALVLPDKITIFQEPIERLAQTKKDVKKIVRKVVWHEIAHYFGFGEKETRILEKKW